MARRPDDFDLGALYNALNKKRLARGLSWAQLAKEINRVEARKGARHPLASSTIKGIATRAAAEGDGVLQMLLWLDQPPEDFVANLRKSTSRPEKLPKVPSSKVLRFDTKKIHAALDKRRKERAMTWAQIGKQVGLPAASLSYLAVGKRTWFPAVMRITRWLQQPAAQFTRACNR